MGLVKYVFIGGVLLAAFGGGYYIANNKWELRYSEFQVKQEQEYNRLLQEKIEADKVNRERVQEIETDYLKQIEEQKAQHEKDIAKLRNNFKPSGVFQGNTASGADMPRTSNDTRGLVCYTESELQGKIAASLDIGRQADELALKYNALLEICKGN